MRRWNVPLAAVLPLILFARPAPAAPPIQDDFQTGTGAWDLTHGFARVDVGAGQYVLQSAGTGSEYTVNATLLPAQLQIDLDFQRTTTPSTTQDFRFLFHLRSGSGDLWVRKGYQLRYVDDWGTDNDGLQLWEKIADYGAENRLAVANVPLNNNPHHLRISDDGTGLIRVYFDDMAQPVIVYDDSASYLGGPDQVVGVVTYGTCDGWIDNVTVYVDEAPQAVTDLAAGNPDWFKIGLTWTAPSDLPPGRVAGYDIRYSQSPIDDGNWAAATQCAGEPAPSDPGQQQSFQVTGLQPDTQYYFALKSLDAGGKVSPLSNVASATTGPLDTVPPDPVIDLTVGQVKANRVTLGWTATGDDGGLGPAGAYDVRYSSAGPITDANWDAATQAQGEPAPAPPGQPEAFAVTGLQPQQQYWFALKVGDEVPNWSALSNVVSATTLEEDLTPPDPIADLRVPATHIHTAYLAWTAPADPGTAGMGTYDLRYAQEPITELNWDSATQVSNEPAPALAGTRETFQVTGLQPNTQYFFAIQSADLAEPPNVSQLSNVASGTTLPPVAPVVIRNPWIANDRVADCRSLATMTSTFGNAYTPDGVVPPATTEQQVINVYNNFKRRVYHWGQQPPNNRDVVQNVNVFGWTLCGSHAAMVCTILYDMGIPPRSVSIESGAHTFFEANYAGKWHALDTMTTFYVYNRDNPRNIDNCAEMKADPSLILTAVAEARACPGFLLCGDTPEWFANGMNTWTVVADPGTQQPTHSMDMDLRMGESLVRTLESWSGQHCPSTPDPPYHHESQNDWKDTVNYFYWEPYALYGWAGKSVTYRRYANGTYVLAPDFRSAGYQAATQSSANIATYNDDGLSPDLHVAATAAPAQIVFRIKSPFYLTDGWIDGTFVRNGQNDVNRILLSPDGTQWTQVWSHPSYGTVQVQQLDIGTNVYGRSEYWVKIELQANGAITDAGVSDLAITTVFEHNKGAMPYLDKGLNTITVTLDNPQDLVSGAAFKVTYRWKEYDGAGWTIDRLDEQYITASPTVYTISVAGSKVPRTELITLEVTPPPLPDTSPPAPITDLETLNPDATTMDLTWTATGDDGPVGRATAYDLRYATQTITEDTWPQATPVPGVPAPKTAGSTESFTVPGLQPSTTYYFAIKARDEGGNLSELSNVAIGTTTPPDVTPPAAITDLSAQTSTQSGAVDLSWTAPGDDGLVGTAGSYDLRYSTSPITPANWAAATPAAGVPSPHAAGSAEQFRVPGLELGQLYYFAIKTSDEVPNESDLSNVASARAARLGEVTLQVGLNGYTGCRDTYVDAGSPTTNLGTSERMTVCGYADSGATNRQRGLVRFDLSSIAAGTTITQATLWLYSWDVAQTKGSTGLYGAYRLTRDWGETAATWNSPWTTPGGDCEAAPDVTAPKHPPADIPCWYSFDVTARVQEWINNPSGNFGWLVRCTDENLHNQDRFYQKDTVNALLRPKLVITDLGGQEPALVSTDPAADGTLAKQHYNVILLTFEAPISLPAGPALRIVNLHDSSEVGASFTYSIEPDGVTLKAMEVGAVLANRNWYRVSPAAGFHVQPFALDLCTLQGDADGSGQVLAQDYFSVKNHLFELTEARYDLDGDGLVLAQDYFVVKNHLFNAKPPKP